MKYLTATHNYQQENVIYFYSYLHRNDSSVVFLILIPFYNIVKYKNGNDVRNEAEIDIEFYNQRNRSYK